MPEEYQLPVEGYYQQPPADPMGYALPVAQPIPADNSRIYISPKSDVIPTRDEPILHSSGKQLKAVDYDPWANVSEAGIGGYDASEHPLLKQLFGLGGEPRVQLWPERMVRAGVTAAHDVMSGATPQWAVDPETGDVHTSPQMIEAGLDTAALAGTGGLAGTIEATLGSGPFLRPALKHNGKIYKGKEGQQHLDVLPKELQADFNQKAMTGEDISHYNFGFMNHKGQFLNREAALDYAVKEGLIDPTAGQYGALTSTLLSDSSKPGIAIEAMKKPTFYSASEHNVNNIGQAKMTGDQWLGTLANKPGVKPEELQWTGLKDFLEENKGKPVTKEQIQQHLEQNKVELKEVIKSNETQVASKDREEFEELHDRYRQNFDNLSNAEYDRMQELENKMNDAYDLNKSDTTKYHSYQLPGGSNYKEMLLTLPTKSNSTADMLTLFPHALSNIKSIEDVALARQHNVSFRESFKGVEDKDIFDNVALADKLSKTSNYKSSHWDEPNILAHVRMNDRTIEGKKSLHLEEIQSDWHQQGREKGYKPNEVELKNLNEQYQAALRDRQKYDFNSDEYRAGTKKAEELGKKLRDARDLSGSVPDAPFKKTWHELALKRMLREAAEKNYDRLSWTPGEAQAARYDLSEQVNSVQAIKNSDGTYQLAAQPTNGNNATALGARVTKDKLSDIVGKELADKINKQEENTKIYSGIDLKVGGEGMKGFYDKMIPAAIEKIGKEHGVKVKSDTLPHEKMSVQPGYKEKSWDVMSQDGTGIKKFNTKAEADQYVKERGQKVHYIDVPQSLKDIVLRKGQPLFSSAHPGVTFSQVDHDPWEKKNATKEK